MLLGIMLMTMTASMILSNSATTAMVIASVMPLIRSLGKNTFSKALLIGIPIAASVGGMGTIIGSPTNAIAVGVLENKGITMDFLKWMYFGIPLASALTLIGWWMLNRIYVSSNDPIEIELHPLRTCRKRNKKKRLIVVVILIVSIASLDDQFLHRLSCFCCGSSAPGISDPDTHLNIRRYPENPWDTLCWLRVDFPWDWLCRIRGSWNILLTI